MKKLFLLATLAAILGLQVTYNVPTAVGASTYNTTDTPATLLTGDGTSANTANTTASGVNAVTSADTINISATNHIFNISGDASQVAGLAGITATADGDGTVNVNTNTFTIASLGTIGASGNAVGAFNANGGTVVISERQTLAR